MIRRFILIGGLCLLLFSLSGQSNKITVNLLEKQDTISKHIYGHFAEHLGRGIYDGFFVGKDSAIPNINGIRIDVVEALRELDIPVLRWPGGCFAEQYHWKDGIGPVDDRPKVVNVFWGGVTEDNSFGTHEFLELCELLGTEPYIAVNIASGTVREASEWIEYVTSDTESHITNLRKSNGRDKPWAVKYWGIGNENWGCGGSMTAQYYTDVFKRYSTYCNGEYKIASGGVWNDLNWTETFMKGIQEVPNFIHIADGLSYHYYTISNNWAEKGSSTEFSEDEWYRSMQNTLKMESNLEEHIAVMDKYDPDNKIALIADEWGTWYDVEPGTNPGFLYQQNTLRDALVASLGLNIFNNHARRIKMANIAQTINVLQAMILTRDHEMIKTPTFYVFKMFKVHQDAMLLPTQVMALPYESQGASIPSLSVSASQNSEGLIHITIANVHHEQNMKTSIDINGLSKLGNVSAEIITNESMSAFNDFGTVPKVGIQDFSDYTSDGNSIDVNIPSKSVMLLKVQSN